MALRSFVHSSNALVHAHNVEKVPHAHGSQITDPFVNVRQDTLEARTLSAEPNAMEIVIALLVDRLVSTEYVRIHVINHVE